MNATIDMMEIKILERISDILFKELFPAGPNPKEKIIVWKAISFFYKEITKLMIEDLNNGEFVHISEEDLEFIRRNIRN